MLWRNWIVMFGLLSGLAQAQTVLEVIPLKYRSVAEMIPILQPFVGAEGALSGMNHQLIVRATPENMAQIRQILGRMDTLPRRLRIQVRQGESSEAERTGGEVSGRIKAGDVTVRVPAQGRDGASVSVDGARARVWSGSSQGNEDNVQTVQVMEGRQAFIRLGQALPVRESTVVRDGYGSRVVESTRYEEIGTGFYVVPRVQGDRVTLEISPQQERLVDPRQPAIEVQRLSTTLSGHLGEWMELGGLSQDKDESGTGWLHGNRETAHMQRRVWVRVEALP